jgi:6-hydroxynicotinate 3-monooxygenase
LVQGLAVWPPRWHQGSSAAQAMVQRPHTSRVSQHAYFTCKLFHHVPKLLQPLRDFIFDHTPFLQKVVSIRILVVKVRGLLAKMIEAEQN